MIAISKVKIKRQVIIDLFIFFVFLLMWSFFPFVVSIFIFIFLLLYKMNDKIQYLLLYLPFLFINFIHMQMDMVSDLYSYYLRYLDIYQNGFFTIFTSWQYKFEFLFYSFQYIVAEIFNGNEYAFKFFNSFAIYFLLYIVIIRICTSLKLNRYIPIFALFFLFFNTNIIGISMHIVRQIMATAIMIFLLVFIIKTHNKKLHKIILFLVPTFFHYTSFLISGMFLIIKKFKINLFGYFILLFLSLFIGFTFNLLELISHIPFLSSIPSVEKYMFREEGGTTLIAMIYFLAPLVLIFSKHSIDNNYFLLYFSTAFLLLLSINTNLLFVRIYFYLIVIYFIVFPIFFAKVYILYRKFKLPSLFVMMIMLYPFIINLINFNIVNLNKYNVYFASTSIYTLIGN